MFDPDVGDLSYDPAIDPGVQLNRAVTSIHALREEVTHELYETKLVQQRIAAALEALVKGGPHA